MSKTQKKRVKNRLLKHGSVNNFSAIDNKILRLGAIIHDLRKEGMKIVGGYGKEFGTERKYWKNYYYFIKS